MAFPERLSGEDFQHKIGAILQRLQRSKDVDSALSDVLDIAMTMSGADRGTLQRFDEKNDWLEIVASRGFSDEALAFFRVVRRDTNTTCAVALTRRMRVFVEDVSTSYLFVGTPELDMLRQLGIGAAQSTPLISSTGRFWGVFTTHFRDRRTDRDFDQRALDRLATQVADRLDQNERSNASTGSFP
jgi:GAF domain-containing protein